MNGNDFLAMGGYAAFVWPCFALVLAVLIGNAISARCLHRAVREQAQKRLDAGRART